MPELIYEGHVYIAMPPLYKAIPSKGQEEYLYDDAALERSTVRDTMGQFYLTKDTRVSVRWMPNSCGRLPLDPKSGS